MPRSFDMAAEYEGSVEQVHQAFSDEQYWLERLADSGADDDSLDSMTVDDDGIDVVTTQTLRSDRLPGVVTQFHRGDLTFVREEAWIADPRRAGHRDGQGLDHRRARDADRHRRARPGKSGGGSRLEFKATVEVRVPLVGGKIENFIGSQLVDLLIAEQRFTTAWITENACSP